MHLSRRLKCSIVTNLVDVLCVVCRHIFDFSSKTAEQNSMKHVRKQDLNLFYQVCVFWADRKNKMAAPASDWLRHFRLLLWNLWMELNEIWQEARSQRPLPSLYFSCWSENKMAALASDRLRHFLLLFWNRWMEFNKTWQEARSQSPLPCLYYSGQSVNKNGRPGLKKGGTLYSGARYMALWASCLEVGVLYPSL